MEQIKIDLQKTFQDNLCSFDVAKKLKEAGMTCANTYYAFDDKGQINDGAWMENPEKIKERFGLKDFNPPVMYPAINLAMAIGMIEDTDIDVKRFECYQFNGKYFFKYKDETYQSEKLVDVMLQVWLKHSKK
jgi:hypothetical protein